MLTVQTFDRNNPSQANVLDDWVEINYTTSAQGGFLDAKVSLSRDTGNFYNDVGFNYRMKILTDDGEIVWEGKITSVPQPYSFDKGTSFSIVGTGDTDILSYRTDLWKPNYATATDIGTMFRDGLAAYNALYSTTVFNYSTSTVPNTGRSIVYQPGNGNTTDGYGSLVSHFSELLKYGDSSNNILTYQIWQDRTFYLKTRSLLSTPAYETTVSACDSIDAGINSDTFYTRVTVQYRDAFDTKFVTVSLGDSIVSDIPRYDVAYGTTFGSAGIITPVPFNRMPEIVDITSHGVITFSQAQAVAATLLRQYAANGVRLSGSSITISNPNVVFYKNTGTIIDLAKIKAGESILIRDLSGTDLNLYREQASMFITQTSVTYNNNGLSIQLSGENQISTDAVLGTVLSGIPTIPLSNGDS